MFFSFNSDTVGSTPSGWTVRNGGAFAVEPESSWAGADGQYLELNAPVGESERFISIDHLDGESDVEITTMLVSNGGTDSIQNGIVFRSQADPANGSYLVGYITGTVSTDEIYIDRYDGGWSNIAEASSSFGDLTVGTWYWLKARIEGDQISAKVWPIGGSEPGWDIQVSNPSSVNGTLHGVGGYYGNRFYGFDSVTADIIGAAPQYDPQDFTATQVNNTVQLQCTASPTSGVTAYEWFRRSPATGVPFDPEVATPLAQTLATSYTDDGISYGTQYEYQAFGVIGGSGGGGDGPAPLGIWIDKTELDSIPIEGADSRVAHWNTMVSRAGDTWASYVVDGADTSIARQLIAGALVWARRYPEQSQAQDDLRTKVANQISSAISNGVNTATSNTQRSRKALALPIAADLINLAEHDPTLHGQFQTFLETLITAASTTGAGSPSVSAAPGDMESLYDQARWRFSNTSLFSRSSCIAAAIYNADTTKLTYCADAHRGGLGDRAHYDEWYWPNPDGQWSWMPDPNTVSTYDYVLPSGVTKDGVDMSGVAPEDFSRNGAWVSGTADPPIESTDYPRVGFTGMLVCTELLYRAGYTSKTWESSATLRAYDAIWRFSQDHGWSWFGNTPFEWVHPLIDYMYGTGENHPITFARNVDTMAFQGLGWTRWTHADRSS